MTAAIYYHPEAYSTQGPRLMGRNAAGESFLRGFLKYSKSSEFWVQAKTQTSAQHFADTVRANGRLEPVRAIEKSSLPALTQAGVLYLPGPNLAEHAYDRAAYGHESWSLCGITHTTSSAIAMDAIANLITAPVQPWDALICTSTAVKDNVNRVLQAQVDYLQDRLGISRMTLPQLPVIPLGIHTRDFEYTSAQRDAAREALGAAPDALVVLYMGRLSFHAKAHPLAMYQALQKASIDTGRTVILLECGWHANDAIANAFNAAAQLACPAVRVVTLDGRKPEERQTAWAGADVFCSLSDNIQESFGIVPIEAMAAGLPVVVSDWDGYKDTVRDGIDGFRVPTLMPGAGLGSDFALRHALEVDTYDMYCGHASALVAVDIDAAAAAFTKLFKAPELRGQMGGAGRERARELFDWASVIPRYEVLWAQLNELRATHGIKQKRLTAPWPARMDPFLAFGAYPTRILQPETVLELAADKIPAARRLQDLRQLVMINFAKIVLPTDTEIDEVLRAAAYGPSSAAQLVASLPAARQPFVFRSLVWLVKLGILRVQQ